MHDSACCHFHGMHPTACLPAADETVYPSIYTMAIERLDMIRVLSRAALTKLAFIIKIQRCICSIWVVILDHWAEQQD